MSAGPGHTSPEHVERAPIPQGDPKDAPSTVQLRKSAPESPVVAVETPHPDNPRPSKLRTSPLGLHFHRKAVYAGIRAKQARTAFGGISRPDIDPKTGQQRTTKSGRPAMHVEAPTQNRIQIWRQASRKQRNLRAQLRCGDITPAEYSIKSLRVRGEQVSTPRVTGSMRRTARKARLLHHFQLPAAPPEALPPVTNPPKTHWLDEMIERFAQVARDREQLNTLKANYDNALMAIPDSVEEGPNAELNKQRARNEILKTLLKEQYQIGPEAYEEFITSQHGKRLVEMLNRFNSEDFAAYLLGRNTTIGELIGALKIAQEKSAEAAPERAAKRLQEEVSQLWETLKGVRHTLRTKKDDPAEIEKARAERDRIVPHMRALREKLNTSLYGLYAKHTQTKPGEPVNIYAFINNIEGHWVLRPDGSAVLYDGNGQKPAGEFKPNGVCHYMYPSPVKEKPKQPEAQPIKQPENEKLETAPKRPVYRYNAGQDTLEHLERELADRMHVLDEIAHYLLENRNDPNKVKEVRRQQYIFELAMNSRDKLRDLINRIRTEQKLAPEE